MRLRPVAVAVAGVAVALCCATPAHADAETDYLAALTELGLVVYDARQALATGYAICTQLDYRNGRDVVEDLYLNAPEVPSREVALAWLVAAGTNLCPWHYHKERLNPVFIA